MSVTFSPKHHGDDEFYCNVANTTARDLIVWLGLPNDDDLCGEMPANELAALCRRRLWPIERNADPGIPAMDLTIPGHCTAIGCGRRPGRLPEVAAELIKICEAVPGGTIYWC